MQEQNLIMHKPYNASFNKAKQQIQIGNLIISRKKNGSKNI